MKIELEIDEEALLRVIYKEIANNYAWKIKNKSDEIFESMNWSKMVPHVQEAILKMAAEKLFDKDRP